MPELPEVETVVRTIRPRLAGRRIIEFESLWPRNTAPSVAAVKAGLRGATIEAVERRAKFVVWRLSAGFLFIHLRMSGRFAWAAGGHAEPPQHVRARWTLDDGARLLFCDARKFGRIALAPTASPPGERLGPEPLDDSFTPAALAALLRGRRRMLKPLLLDQRVVAGLGNIYVDESLHRARLHPMQSADRVSPARVAALHAAIQAVLREAIDRNGTSFDWVYPGGQMQPHLFVYGRDGRRCLRCAATIVAIRVAQRGTHICPRCQRMPRTG